MEKKINFEAKKVILIAFSILLISFVCALPPIPPLPDHFIGNVSINGQNAPIGTQISIYVNSTLESIYGVLEAGKYDVFVKTGSINDTIKFKIQDKVAGSATRGWGETIYLDLSITTSSDGGSSDGSSNSGGSSSGSSGGIISLPPTDESDSEENTQTPETEEQEGTGSRITGAVIGFLGSGKGIITIGIVIVLIIGVILIKLKAPRWKRN